MGAVYLTMDVGTFVQLLAPVNPRLGLPRNYGSLENPAPGGPLVRDVSHTFHICLCGRKPARVADLIGYKLVKSRHVETEMEFVEDRAGLRPEVS